MEGEVRFHHVAPDMWVLEARSCAHRWVVFHETYSFCLVSRFTSNAAQVSWKYNHRLYLADPDHRIMAMQPGELHANVEKTPPAHRIIELRRPMTYPSPRMKAMASNPRTTRCSANARTLGRN